MSHPLLSVGLPVFNGAERIGRTLDSLLAQGCDDIEIIISDNGSTDQTRESCEAYARRDKRVRYYRNASNIGVNRNHDRVFELAKGTYFTWSADDVEYLPGMLKRCVETMNQASSAVVLVYPRCEMICSGKAAPSPDGESIASNAPQPHQRLVAVVRHVVMVNQLYGVMKREVLGKTRLNGLYPSSDYVLLAELAMLGEIREIPEVLMRRRIDSDRGTSAVLRDRKAWAQWMDPENRHPWRNRLPYRERLAVEYLLGAWGLPLRWADKYRCLLSILPAYYGRMSRTGRWLRRVARR